MFSAAEVPGRHMERARQRRSTVPAPPRDGELDGGVSVTVAPTGTTRADATKRELIVCPESAAGEDGLAFTYGFAHALRTRSPMAH